MPKRLKPTQVPDVLKKIVARQNHVCAVCGHAFTKRDYAVLDHDHDTGFIRGALHNSCNGAEGRIKSKARLGHKGVDAYDYLIGLGKYLEQHVVPKFQLLHPTHLTEDEKRIERNRKARERRKKKT